jgi:hypothetical protein
MNCVNLNFIRVLTVVSAVSSGAALACSYYIDPVAVKNDLAAATLTKLKVNIEDVTKVKFTDFGFFESKPTPMCPEEMTYFGTIRVNFTNVQDPLTKGCTAEVKVTKVATWSPQGVPDKTTFEVLQSPTCLE